MTSFFKQHKNTLVVLLAISVLYFVVRLPHLTLQPVFTDEAIYIRWAQVMKAEPSLRFLPLTDGKTPLFMWAMAPFLKVFSDPLFAGRLLSVLSGFLTLLGVTFLGWKFFNPRVGIWAAFLVAVTPFMVFFDRMALVDSMLTAFSIWSLNFALLLIKYKRLDLAMFLGYFLGGGLLTKTPGIINMALLPVAFLTFKWKQPQRVNNFLKTVGLFAVAVVIGAGILNILRLGPGFYNLSSRDSDYRYSVPELLQHPLDPLLPHLKDVGYWMNNFLTVPIMFLIFVSIILAVKRRNLTALTLVVWSLAPIVVLAAGIKAFTARYILMTIPTLLILMAWGMDILLEKFKFYQLRKVGLMIVVVPVFAFMFDYHLLDNPATASLPAGERNGYLENWTAGYGMKDIAQFLIAEAQQKGTVVVGTEGYFGTLPDGLQIYLDRYSHTASENNKVIVIGGTATVSAQIRQAALDHPTYFISNKSRFSGAKNLELIKTYPKAIQQNGEQDAILVFKVLPGI